METRINFDTYSWSEFEELTFQFASVFLNWNYLYWLGHAGNDGGRDLWGENQEGVKYCFQCKRHKVLNATSVKHSIDTLLRVNKIPDKLIIVCSGKVSERKKESIRKYGLESGIRIVEILDGREFEALIKLHASDLIEGKCELERTSKKFTKLRMAINYWSCMNSEIPELKTLTKKCNLLLIYCMFSLMIFFITFNFTVDHWTLYLGRVISAVLFVFILAKFLFQLISGKGLRLQSIFVKEAYVSRLSTRIITKVRQDSKGHSYETTTIIPIAQLQLNNGKRITHELNNIIADKLNEGDIGLVYISEFNRVVDMKYLTYDDKNQLILC